MAAFTMTEIQCPHCEQDVELEDGAFGWYDCPHCDVEFSYGGRDEVEPMEVMQDSTSPSLKRKKFAGPGILAGLAILMWQSVYVIGNMRYEEGDTLEPGVAPIFLCMGLISALMCLSSIVWFAFALGTKTQKRVVLAEAPGNFQQNSVPLARGSQSTVVPSTIGGGPVPFMREKILSAKSGDDPAQMVGFLIVAGSVVMFVLMILLGFFWVLSGLGSGLGGSGGSCDETCEFLGSSAEFSMWSSLLLFPCGVIVLARPWSWFNSAQDIRDSVVKVRIGIVAGIAFIAIISFGWPALVVVGAALFMFAAAGMANK